MVFCVGVSDVSSDLTREMLLSVPLRFFLCNDEHFLVQKHEIANKWVDRKGSGAE